jgi:SPX domain protein involved in polyphosphate accumulation
VLTVGGRRLNHYQTLYFDTPDFDIYHQHHNGWGERYKVRARRYVGSDVAFFEVKHRTNRSRTIKSRLSITEVTTQMNGAAIAFVDANTPFASTILEPKLWNDYQRVTLVSMTSAERVTIDLNVEFGWEDAHSAFPNIAIIEVKQASLSQSSEFKTQMRQLGLRAGSFSKYCVGVYTLYHPPKSNNFKSYFRQLTKAIGADAYVALR